MRPGSPRRSNRAIASRLFIVGAGGLGRTVLQFVHDAASSAERIRAAGFLDDNLDSLAGYARDVAVVGTLAAHRPRRTDLHLIAVADPAVRERLAALAAERGARFHTLVHPSACVAPTARLGAGCVIAPFAFVGPDAVLGDHVFVHAHAFIDHDVRVGPFSYLGPHAVVCGFANLGASVRVGPRAAVGAKRVLECGTAVGPGEALL